MTCEDAKDLVTPSFLSWKTPIGHGGLKNGETHSPNNNCPICDLIFSIVSPSAVHAILRGIKPAEDKKPRCFVYLLKNETDGSIEEEDLIDPECLELLPKLDPELLVRLEADKNLIPMIRLRICRKLNMK